MLNLTAPILTTERGKALIVDDEPTIRLILKAQLVKKGYQVCEAADGRQAVQQFQQEKPDIVFMDVMMPEMDGYSAARQIKQISGQNFVPVIFLTALTDEDELARCIEAGGDDFITKPFNRTLLEARIQAIERIRNLYRTVQRQHELLLHDEQLAEEVFSNVVTAHNIELENIQVLHRPAVTFSGDLVLSAMSPSGEVYIMLGDFTGHGLAAAIGAFPASQIFQAMTSKGFTPEKILAEMNAKLHQLLPTGMFFAACLVTLYPASNRVAIWNGGLPEALIYRPASGQIFQRVRSSHLALGVLPDLDDSRIELFEVMPEDQIIILTDGLLEAENDTGIAFGENSLLQAIENANADVFTCIIKHFDNFLGSRTQVDDISMVVVKCEPASLFRPAAKTANADSKMPVSSQADRGDVEWVWSFELGTKLLRDIDPVPVILGQLTEFSEFHQHRQALFTVLAELYNNALEHGVLGLDSELKSTADGFSRYFEQREERLAGLTSGRIQIHFEKQVDQAGASRLHIRVHDSGDGFDYADYQQQLENKEKPSGRGIRIVQELCESVTYNELGNSVEAVFFLQ